MTTNIKQIITSGSVNFQNIVQLNFKTILDLVWYKSEILLYGIYILGPRLNKIICVLLWNYKAVKLMFLKHISHDDFCCDPNTRKLIGRGN